MAFYVYILRCSDGSYYTGHTENVEGRLSIHKLGLYRGYTSSRRPVTLMWSADFPTRAEALEYELRVKKWSRAKKEALIAGNWDLLRALSRPPGKRSPSALRGASPARGSAGLTTNGRRASLPGGTTIARRNALPPRGSTGLTTNGRRASSGAAAGFTDAELQAWLRDELGLDEYGRVVRENETTVVVSKFEAGFSQELFATVDRLPELFDDAVVAAEYGSIAERYVATGEDPLRTRVWREASEAVLNRAADARGIDARQRLFVLPGIESVQAILDTILWTGPTVLQAFEPSAGERQALEEFQALASHDPAEAGRDVFTRFYGVLDGRRVENYCPGAPYGRRLVAQAWRICTAARAPAEAGHPVLRF
jgi:predicted GIY-YIG superfamily endonuclease